MLMLALRLILKDKGGKQHCLPFVDSNLGIEMFLKKRYHQKRMHWDFKKILCKACLLFNCFLGIKGILKALFSFIPSLLNFSNLPNWLKFEEKIYTRAIVKVPSEEHPSPYLG